MREGLTRGIHDLDRPRVTWIAATLIRNTERDIRRDLHAAWAEVARQDPLPEDGVAGLQVTPSTLGLPDGLDQDAAACLLVDRLHRLLGADAALVVAVAVQGERHHEAAERLGLTPEAARKRYQRALKRLRVEFEEFS